MCVCVCVCVKIVISSLQVVIYQIACRTKCWEGNVLFNDAPNTFYLRLYGVRHMVKDHSDTEKGNPLPPHRLLLYGVGHNYGKDAVNL